MKKLNLRLSPAARDFVLSFRERSGLSEPVIGLLKGRDRGEVEERWCIGGFEREQTRFIASEVEKYGHDIFYDVDGIEMVIDQFQYLDELDGKILDVSRGRFVLLDDPNGT